MTRNQTTKTRHRPNGDGSVYKRKDGYWVGAFYARTASGARKPVSDCPLAALDSHG